ncbi:MAG: DinB family protein [Chitinophagaceae bacterium]|nr:DinB family protein [Chitinophagaceae bacterium]
MKQLLQQYAAYNAWASKLLFERISKLSEEEINKEIVSSFPSVYKTVQHMWLAEEVWWQRLKLVEHIELQSDKFTGSFNEMAAHLSKQSQQWVAWVDGATDNQFEHVFAYVRNKEQQKMPVYEMLQHVFNHGTYHRGQLVTMLRQLGADKIPQTDFTVFCRKK